MEDLSGQISENLHNQSNRLQGTTSKVKEVNSVLQHSSSILDRMLNRANRRALTVRITLLIVAAIIAAMWLWQH